MKATFLIASILVVSSAAFAEENDRQKAAYCKYVLEQGKADRDLLRTPSAIVEPTEPSSGTPPQVIFGVTASLADTRRASLTMKAARTSCELYSATTEVQQRLEYFRAKIDREVLTHRLDLIRQASDQLQKLISNEEQMVRAQNLTRPALYYLQSTRIRLEMNGAAAIQGAVLPYAPTLNDVPVRELIGKKQRAEQADQKAKTRLAAESGWDLKLAAGGRRQLDQYNSTATVSTAGAFGELSLTYSFARHSANEHLGNAAHAYLDWKAHELDEVEQQADILRKQIEETISFLQPQLRTLLDHDSEISDNLKSVEDVDTSNAVIFRNQLLSDQILLRVDIGDLQFRLDALQSYLRNNF